MSWWLAPQTTEAMREALAQAFFEYAQTGFERFPDVMRVELWVGQYWNDQADDEVHGVLVIELADAPSGDHICDRSPASICQWCMPDDAEQNDWLFEFPWAGLHGTLKRAIEPYCVEGAHQDMDTHDACRPFLRLTRGAVQVERIGRVLRPWLHTAVPVVEVPPPELAPLFEAVYARPADDGPRLVLADLLQSRGDPRGRFIALQMQADPTGAMRKEADALWQAHRARWLGRLLPVASLERCAARRGFISTLAFMLPPRLSPDAERALFADIDDWPEWHTVEHVDLGFDQGYMIFDRLRQIDRLTVPDAAVPAMISRGAWQCRHLTLPGWDTGELSALQAPNLETLTLTWVGESSMLVSAPWWPQLTQLTFTTEAAAAVRAGLAHPTAQIRFTFRPNWRTAHGIRVGPRRLRLTINTPRDWAMLPTLDMLPPMLPDGGIGWTVEAQLTDAQIERLNDIGAARWIKLE